MNCVGTWTVYHFVDRCRVWESHGDPEIRRVSKPGPEPIYPAYVVGDSDKVVEEIRVAAVTKPKSTPDQVEDFSAIQDAGGSTCCADPSAGCIYDSQSATVWRNDQLGAVPAGI